jgi:hypothetical protein
MLCPGFQQVLDIIVDRSSGSRLFRGLWVRGQWEGAEAQIVVGDPCRASRSAHGGKAQEIGLEGSETRHWTCDKAGYIDVHCGSREG